MTPLDAFLEFTLSKDWTPATRSWYRSRLGRLLDWLEGQQVTDFTTLTAPLLRRYVATLDTPAAEGTGRHKAGRVLDSHTRNGHVRAIRAWLAWGVAEGLLPPDLPKRVGLPKKESKVLRVLTDAEVEAVFRAAGRTTTPRRDVALLSLLLDTGCRASELCGLRRRDVTLSPDAAWLLVHGKGRKQREVPLGRQATLAMQRYLSRERGQAAPDDAMFIGRGGKPLTAQGLDRLLYRLRDAAKLPHDSPVAAHRWRHLNAIRRLTAGEDVFVVSKLLGHSDIGVTTGYLKAVTGQQLRRMAHSVLDDLKPGR